MSAPAVRAVLRATVTQAAAQAPGEVELFDRLRAAGVMVWERFSELNSGQIAGYAATLPEYAGSDGTLRRGLGGG